MTGALASDPYILGISLGSIFVTDIKEHIVYVDRYKGTHSLCSQEMNNHIYVPDY